MKNLIVLFTVISLVTSPLAYAKGRTPCSGKKGGVKTCLSGKFVCNDGSISKSKKICK